MRTKGIFIGLMVVLIAGCSTTSGMKQQVSQVNAAKEARYEPTRVKLTVLDSGGTNLEYGVWAGAPGMTAANERYRQMIFDSFKSSCGLDKSQLKEVRVVKHEPPTWYEVWVFNDPESGRPDKTSGMSVVMNYNKITNVTNVDFVGSCH